MSESSLEIEPCVPATVDGQSGAVPHPTRRTRIYSTGTLQYTLGALVWLFIWLLWGDFCNTIFSVVFSNFLPLYLHQLQAPNTLISFLGSGVGGAANMLLLPNISIWSDRHRGRFGRRIPFLFWSTPVVALGLLGLGYTPQISRWLHGVAGPWQSVSLDVIAVVVVSFMVFAVNTFQVILCSTYQFLFRDVVPQEAMPWFLTFFRVVGVLANSVFSFFFFGYIVSHPRITCLSTAFLFLSSFWLICWGVKEGHYSPPPPRLKGDAFRRAVANYLRYFRECMAVAIYRNFVFVFVLVLAGNVGLGTFTVLFATKTLGISAAVYGEILGAMFAAGSVMYVLVGYLCKRWHAMGVILVSLALLTIGQLAVYFLVQGTTGWLVYSVASQLPLVGWWLGSFIVTMALYPSENFGELSSSLGTIGFGSLVVTTMVIGRCMDFFGGNYRMAFVLSAVCYGGALLPMYRVYRDWRHRGGPNNYVPPLPGTRAA